MRHQTEVCSVSRRMMLLALNPYLRRYSIAFAFSVLLYLLLYRLPSRVGFLATAWENNRLTTFRADTVCNVGSVSTPGVHHLRGVS